MEMEPNPTTVPSLRSILSPSCKCVCCSGILCCHNHSCGSSSLLLALQWWAPEGGQDCHCHCTQADLLQLAPQLPQIHED